MDWISVNKALPIEDVSGEFPDVLISDGINVGIGYFHKEIINEEPDENGLLYSDEVWYQEGHLLNENYSGWPQVTHWKPLPLPPND